MIQRVDNGNLSAKLDLRRYFLRKYQADDKPNVLDCCQGGGVIWDKLRQEFDCEYWGVDQKQKKGRLKINSVRILAQRGWQQNVVDIDTYGSPWKHWVAMLPNVAKPTTVFLTIGKWMMGVGVAVSESLGIGKLPVPPAILGKLSDFSLRFLLTRACEYGLILTEAVEAVSTANARYIGVRLVPKESGSMAVTTDPATQRT